MNESQNPISRRSAIRTGTIVAAGAAVAGTQFIQPASASTRDHRRHHRRHRMSLTQQAGQRVIFSYPGLTPPERLLRKIRAGEVGGVIFFGENISSLAQIADVVAQLKRAHCENRIDAPLVLTTDQEGGYIRRLPGAPELSEKKIGESADPKAAARQAGTGAGKNLAGVGMNVNLAPVLDVFRVPGNFDDQWERSYSSDPRMAGTLGAEFVRAQQHTNVAATIKHFPGLGAAAKDENTDLGAVTLELSRSELRRIDERAFQPAIRSGADIVMTSWAKYPALDNKYPAGLSARIVQGELRRRLGFRGVTMTDALEAGALAEFGTDAECGVMAARAGMDMLLCSARDVGQGEDTVAALAHAVRHRRLSESGFASSVRRVLRLRERL